MGCSANYYPCRSVAICILAALLLTACVTPVRLAGSPYTHLMYHHPAQRPGEPLTLVYIEGDGKPWVAGGTQTASDPTPIHTLAFNLFKHTTQSAWYVTRPCYNRVNDPHCKPLVWTDARYSEAVVASMTAAINSFAATQPTQRIVLIGYSGGGALATLLVARIPNLVGVITIAANLDTQAWTNMHGYEALTGSLNPADLPALDVPHVALVGDQDMNVPFVTIAHYLQQQPHTIVQHYHTYDHVCCWEKNWPALLEAALAQLQLSTH